MIISEDPAFLDALSRVRSELVGAARRQAKNRRRRRVALAAGVFTLAAVSTASAAVVLGMRDLTPADVARQATVVRDDSWLDCSSDPCVTAHGSHEQVDLQPWMGVTFVLPSGFPVRIYPSAIGLGPLPTRANSERKAYGLPGLHDDGVFTSGDIAQSDSGGQWRVSLGAGKTRTISWRHDSGATTVVDRDHGGITQTVALHSGDVVSLVPHMPGPQQRTPVEAVTFDLPNDAQVFIFPRFNETYVGALPDVARVAQDESFAPGTAAQYGLQPVGSYGGALPVTTHGGSWTVTSGLMTRAINWRAGESGVTVQLLRAGKEVAREFVTVGHERPLWPPN
jgi:hypothetical protein